MKAKKFNNVRGLLEEEESFKKERAILKKELDDLEFILANLETISRKFLNNSLDKIDKDSFVQLKVNVYKKHEILSDQFSFLTKKIERLTKKIFKLNLKVKIRHNIST